MRKHLLTSLTMALAAMTLTPVATQAQDVSEGKTVYYLQVVHKDGSELTVPFADSPKFQHNGEVLKLTSAALDLEYPGGTLDHFKILAQNEPVAVSTISAERVGLPIISGNVVTVSNAGARQQIVVRTLDGMVVASATTDNEGNATVSLPSEGSYIYIITVNKSTFKILKK